MTKPPILSGFASARILLPFVMIVLLVGVGFYYTSHFQSPLVQSRGITINPPTLIGTINPHPILINGTAAGTNRIIVGLVSDSYSGNVDYNSLHSFVQSVTNTDELKEAFLFPPIPVDRSHWDVSLDPSTRWYHGIYRILIFDAQSYALLAESGEILFPPATRAAFPTNAYDSSQ